MRAMAVAVILAMQLPLAGVFSFISLKVYVLAMLASVVTMTAGR